jgi:MFS family permease
VTVRERGKYSGLNGMVFAVSSVLGPLLGGVLTDKLSWRWCFYVNIPFGILAFIIMQFNLNIPRNNNKKSKIKRCYHGNN